MASFADVLGLCKSLVVGPVRQSGRQPGPRKTDYHGLQKTDADRGQVGAHPIESSQRPPLFLEHRFLQAQCKVSSRAHLSNVSGALSRCDICICSSPGRGCNAGRRDIWVGL